MEDRSRAKAAARTIVILGFEDERLVADLGKWWR
jgi:hypothetical protein